MLKKTLLTTISLLLLLESNYAINKQDSIYRDLYQFIILQEDMPKIETGLNGGICKNYLDIFEIVSGIDAPDFVSIPFGIYKFQYSGCIDCGYYVLIKYNESYKVYYQESVSLIIEEFLKIKKENPYLIDNDLFYLYLEKLIDDKAGIYGSPTIIQKIGTIEYYK